MPATDGPEAAARRRAQQRSARLARDASEAAEAAPLRLLPAGTVAVLLVLAGFLWWGRAPTRDPAPAAPAPAHGAVGAPAPVATYSAAARPTAVRTDPLGNARDLNAVVQAALATTDALTRRQAGAAWQACFPLFAAPQGQTPGLLAAADGLDDAQRALRTPALQELHARCSSLLALRQDELGALAGTVQSGLRDETLLPAGDAVLQAWQRGDSDVAGALLRETLRASDPAALYSLVGVASRLGTAAPQAGAVDLALLRVACEQGLDCSPSGLAAIELCAGEGLCEGGLQERWRSRSGAADDAVIAPWAARWRQALADGAPPSGLLVR